jgi:putative ABC transport system permease protein
VSTFPDDVRHGLRYLWKNRAHSTIALITMALAIGASAAIFTIVNAVLLRSLPFPESQRIVAVWDNLLKVEMKEINVSAPEFRDYRERGKSFERLAAFKAWDPDLSENSEPIWLKGAAVSADFFDVLGVRPSIGRGFAEADAQAGNDRIVVISDRLARRLYGSTRVLDRQMTLGGHAHTIVGVMPAAAAFPREADLWKPLVLSPQDLNRRGFRTLQVIGRLRPDSSLSQVRAEMDTLAAQIVQAYPDKYPANLGFAITVEPLLEQFVADARAALWMLAAAVGCLLLIACANIANFQLARVVGRSLEISIRTALGSTRRQVLRQLVIESTVLFTAAGAIGLLLAYWGVDALQSLSPEGTIPRGDEIGLDGRVVLFTFAISLICALTIGLAPVWHAFRTDVNETLKQGGKAQMEGAWADTARNVFVTAQLALSLILLIGAGLLGKSLYSVFERDSGVRADGVLTVGVNLVPYRYGEPERQVAFFQRAVEEMRTVPGVQSAAAVSALPFSGNTSDWTITLEGAAQMSGDTRRNADVNTITPGYFQTLGVRLRDGRDFQPSDDAAHEPVAVVNEKLAAQFGGGGTVIGRRLKLGAADSNKPWLTIVGVVGNVRQDGLDREADPELFVPAAQSPARSMTIAVRGPDDAATLAPTIRDRLRALDPNQPLAEFRTLDDLVPRSLALRRFQLVVLAVFATVALILSLVGVYSVTSYAVTRRTREIGLRMALGADARNIFRFVLRRTLMLALIGTVVGLIGAAVLTRVMKSLFVQVVGFDPLVIVALTLFLAGVTVVASYWPARRASRLDPMVALRAE